MSLMQAGIRYSVFEKDVSMNYRSNEWTMAIHWALPLLKEIMPPEVFAKVSDIACNPTIGIHSGLYPIINGETGDLIIGVPYKEGLRVPRSKMRELCAEGINVQVSGFQEFSTGQATPIYLRSRLIWQRSSRIFYSSSLRLTPS